MARTLNTSLPQTEAVHYNRKWRPMQCGLYVEFTEPQCGTHWQGAMIGWSEPQVYVLIVIGT
jgi:hypothetical protein